MNNQLEFVVIFLSSRCNLNCVHCGYKFDNNHLHEELSASFFIDALKQAKELGAHSVNLTGGEILFRKDCFEIIDAAISMGYFVSIETNAVLMTEKHIEKLASYGTNIRVAISMDGLTKEIHEKIRGENTFDRSFAAIKALAAKNVHVRINTVMQKHNYHQIKDMALYFVEELGVGFRVLPSILKRDRKKGADSCSCLDVELPYEISENFLNSFMYNFMRKHKDKDVSVAVNVALAPVDIDNFLLCHWGKSSLGISYDGRISLCHNRNNNPIFTFGNLKTDKLSDIWKNSPKLKQFRDLDVNKLKGVCGKCLAREICRGGCRVHAISEYDDFYAPDPQCQRIFEMGKFPEYALE